MARVSCLAYDIRVKAVHKIDVDLREETQQAIVRLSNPATKAIEVKFFYRDVFRRCVLQAEANHPPYLLPEIRWPMSRWFTVRVPASVVALNHELEKRNEFSSELGISGATQLLIVRKVGAEARRMMRAGSGDGIMSIIVGVAAVRMEVWHYSEYEEAVARAAKMESMDVEAKPIPASKKAIEALERVVVDKGLEDCIVCMEELKEGMQAIMMPCSHLYHQNCIVRWLQSSRFCPLCRYDLPSDSGV